MKIKYLVLIVLAALAAGKLATAAEPDTNVPATNAVAVAVVAPAPPNTNAASAVTAVVTVARVVPATNAPDITESSDDVELTPTNALRMNFHDVPLSTVLNYLSKRMGFVVASETEVRGNVTIVSEQPVSTNEVIGLLSSALAKNNYSVTRNGRVLTITTASDAKTDSPVLSAEKPDQIPMTDEIATYILPVHILNPTQLIKDLDQLIPPGATLSGNEAGNALIMTARKRDIHRFSEIINALDSSSVSDVAVFVLKYADAKSVADELKEVFQSPDSTAARSDSRQRFRGFGMGFPGGPGGEGGGSSSDTKNAANKAVFTSDDQMNAVIASAPADYFRMITNVINELDQPSQDVTVVRVFHLKYADPQETADELSNLFPDDTKTDQNNRSMGFRFNPFIPQQQSTSPSKSERMTRQTTVRAVPEPRTQSLIVTCSSNQMVEITQMIADLDSNPAGVQHVYAFELKNADPATVQATMTALFSGPNTKAQTSTQNTSALQQRATTAAQQQTSSASSGLGSSGSGTTGVH